MTKGLDRSGMSLIAVVVCASILLVIVFAFSKEVSSARSQSKQINDLFLAESYATELLELLRGHTSAQLKTYLGVNPFLSTCNCAVNPTCAACTPYKLCAHINLLDRTNSTNEKTILLNEDPLAKLPQPNPLQVTNEATMQANRYYQVQVVNMTTLARTAAACSTTAAAYSLAANERYLITVGVSWVPKGKALSDLRNTVLTTVIP